MVDHLRRVETVLHLDRVRFDLEVVRTQLDATALEPLLRAGARVVRELVAGR